ncbi:hypothetical protein C0585_01935 [Candidatus Woesearchaeota archaeon]|nr:MAG: hypothetical protein C0585_01935 [Candidatus Woesearchaeota archaeon]
MWKSKYFIKEFPPETIDRIVLDVGFHPMMGSDTIMDLKPGFRYSIRLTDGDSYVGSASFGRMIDVLTGNEEKGLERTNNFVDKIKPVYGKNLEVNYDKI